MIVWLAARKRQLGIALLFIVVYAGLYYVTGKEILVPLRERMNTVQEKVKEVHDYYDPLGAKMDFIERAAKASEDFYREEYTHFLEKVSFRPQEAYRIFPEDPSPKNTFRKKVSSFKEENRAYRMPFLPDLHEELDAKTRENILLKMAMAAQVTDTLKDAGISKASFSDIFLEEAETPAYFLIDRLNRYRFTVKVMTSLNRATTWITSLGVPNTPFYIDGLRLRSAPDGTGVEVDLIALQPTLKKVLSYEQYIPKPPNLSSEDLPPS